MIIWFCIQLDFAEISDQLRIDLVKALDRIIKPAGENVSCSFQFVSQDGQKIGEFASLISIKKIFKVF